VTKIGLLSDTHKYIHKDIFKYFALCDEIWHAGDIGSIMIAEELLKFKPLRAVYGNIDGQDIRKVYPKNQRFTIEKVDVLMTHIGGYPGHYSTEIKKELFSNPPKLFISGHSHILKVMYDKKLRLLHINPGAAGKYGFHLVKTLVLFEIDGERIQNLEVIEMN
jgi:hypothetical protein